MGRAEEAARRRIQNEQNEAARQLAEQMRQRDALVGQIHAEASNALRRLEAKGYPGASLEQGRDTRSFMVRCKAGVYGGRRKERAYWNVLYRTYTNIERGTTHSYAQLFSDCTFDSYRSGEPISTLPRDLSELNTLLANLRQLGK